MAGESGEPGKAALVDALLRVPVMQEPDGRALVLAELAERGYRLDAMRYSRDRHDIWAMMTACLQQPGALAALADVLHGIEGENYATAAFRRLASEHLSGPPGLSGPPPAGPHPPGAGDWRAAGPEREPDQLIRSLAPEFAEHGGVFPHVSQERLTRGAQLGAGARGRVFALSGQPGLVYKEYLSPQVNGGALAELILQRAMMGVTDRKLLDSGTAWPLMRVTAGRQIVGCLMRAIPDDFYIAANDSRRPAYLSYLCYPPRPAWDSIPLPSPADRLEIARGLVDLVSFLQRYALVIGDISAQNLLWTAAPAPHVFLLGCDAIRLNGAPSALPEGETPDWRDPLLHSAVPDIDSDNYKVALMVGRILSQDPYARPGEDLRVLSGIPQAVASGIRERFAAAAGPRGQRPAVSTWADALRVPPAIQLRLPRHDPPDRRTVQPIYLVCDVAGTASGARSINAEYLVNAMREVSWHPVAADRTRIGVAAFSDQARVLLPLSDLSGDVTLPDLSPDGQPRRYGPAFTLMKDLIERDVRQLREDGYRVLRAVIIFVAAGPATDDWEPSFAALSQASGEEPEIYICLGPDAPAAFSAAAGPRIHASPTYQPAEILMSYADIFETSDVIRLPRPEAPSAGPGTEPSGSEPISLEYLDPGDDGIW
jgi:uncharacterized protein YegL